MPSIFPKRGKWWCRLKGDKVPRKWSNAPTGYTLAEREKAERFAEEAQAAIDERNNRREAGGATLRSFVATWLVKRQEAGHDWKKDRGRLEGHVLPALGELALVDVSTAALADLVHDLRFKKKLANRTVRNIYSVLAAVMRDAAFAGKIIATPCKLTDAQLGPIVDKDPEWRASAVFSREEAEAMISDPRIPLDRQLVYAFGLLAGLRIGEAAALRWRHYDPAYEPLGRLQVAFSYNTQRFTQKRTKTETSKSIPVHPTLAAMLVEWQAYGWERMMGRPPTADDLIIPLPPEVEFRKRSGERFRGWDYTGRRWRDLDLPALGWRHRSVYDTKSTFITLAIEDGADPAILRDRVTHTKQKRTAFDGYDRGPHWIATCREVAKLAIRRRAPALLPPATSSTEIVGSEGGFRIANQDTRDNAQLEVLDGDRAKVRAPCDLGMAILGATACTQDENDDG